MRIAAVVALALGCATAVTTSEALAQGHRDFSYGTISAPTADKPQSKLWFHDGTWWGTMWDTRDGRHEIHRLDWSTQTWSSTDVPIDTRRTARADVASAGGTLYIVSAIVPTSSDLDIALKLFRYSYDSSARTYALDSGFPRTVTSAKTESVGLARERGSGRLWITYTRANQVLVAHTALTDADFGSPYVLPVADAGNLDPDDISAIVAYGDRIGVMWSNQSVRERHVLGFASHVNGAGDSAADWQASPVRTGPRVADDHMNLKALAPGDPAGSVVAVSKTGLTAPGSPLIEVHVLRPDGTWSHHTVSTVEDDGTRPILLVDEERRDLHVLMSTPCCSGGTINMKRSSLDDIAFDPGRGTPFIATVTDTTINNVTSTGQGLSSSTGLVALASDDNTKYYVHNSLDLGPDTTAPQTSIVGAPEGTIRNRSASFGLASNEADVRFECRIDGSPFERCASPAAFNDLADGTHTFAVRAVDGAGNTDETPASTSWTISQDAPYSFSPDADATVDAGAPTTNRGTLAFLSTDGGTHVAKEAYVRFTVSGLRSAPTSARLRVYVTNGAGVNGPSVYGTASDWAETAITWGSKPPRSTPALASANGFPADAYLELDVSSYVTGNGTYGLVIATAAADRVDLHSREGVRPPRLLVTEPPDTTPPETTIDSGPGDTSTSRDATFTLSASEPASFECSLDGGAFAACSSPVSLSELTDGDHTFSVRARDDAGNLDDTPARWTWAVGSVLFSDGFESGTFGQWTRVKSATGGSATIQGDTVARGSRAARLTSTGQPGAHVTVRRTLSPAVGRLALTASIRIAAEGAAGSWAPLLAIADAEGVERLSLSRLADSGALRLSLSGTDHDVGATMPAGRWARLSLRAVAGPAGGGIAEVHVDGVLAHRSTTADVGTTGFQELRLGAATKRLSYDELIDEVVARG